MLFNDEFIESISDDPIGCVIQILDMVEASIDPHAQDYYQEEHDNYLEGLSLLLSLSENFDLTFDAKTPAINGSLADDSKNIQQFFELVRTEYQEKATELRLKRMKIKFDTALGQTFKYELSQGDFDRVQELINELRDQITLSPLFEKKHKQRILKRLERLQSELHKRMSDLDRFWGIIGDAGVAIGKFGNDAKPFVDRFIEIAQIIWRTQSRAEELPSGTPMPLLEENKE